MEELWQRFVQDFVQRLDGPLHFRFIVQPLMAVVFAIVDGLRDARTGKPAYFWALATHPEHRREMLRDGWKHFGKIFILSQFVARMCIRDGRAVTTSIFRRPTIGYLAALTLRHRAPAATSQVVSPTRGGRSRFPEPSPSLSPFQKATSPVVGASTGRFLPHS